MTRVDDELDEYGKRTLAPLRGTPALELSTVAQEKVRYMRLGESLRKELEKRSEAKGKLQHKSIVEWFQARRAPSLVRIMVAVVLAVAILASSSLTVYAAQSSLPGEPLYAIKSWSEDVRLSLATSPQSKLDLILDYTERRAGEISQMATSGMTLPDQASERYHNELDSALQLASEMDDFHLQLALGKIKKLAEIQGVTLEELISSLPDQASPAIVHLQERLQEQVDLSTYGEHDPQGFRAQMRERQRQHQGKLKNTPASTESVVNPTPGSLNPEPTQGSNDQGEGNDKPGEAPGHGGSNSAGGNPNPGNSKHSPSPTEDKKP